MPMSDNRLTEKVQAAVRAAVRAAGVPSLLVACSGGGDSVCLAHATVQVARREGWRVVLGHFRHGLPDDDAGNEIVRGLAASLGVVWQAYAALPRALAERGEVTPARRTEEDLRAMRYAGLARMAANTGAAAMLTGHTLDDQAETLLLRLLRGSGVDGLAAMAPHGPFPVPAEARLLRPLLTVTRAETHAYCAAHALAYRDDPSNADIAYTRNWVRHELLPRIADRYPAAPGTFARTAALLRDDATLLHSLTEDALLRCTAPADEAHMHRDATILDRAAFAAEATALQRRVVRLLMARHGRPGARPDKIEGARRVLAGRASRLALAEGVAFWPVYGVVVIGPGAAVRGEVRRRALAWQPLLPLPEPVAFAEGTITFAFPTDAAAPDVRARLRLTPWAADGPAPVGAIPLRLPGGVPLALRNRRPGDRIRPPGAAGSRKVQDYLTEKGIPAPLRDEVVLLTAGDEIVAVVGYDVDTRFHASVADATHLYHLERAEAGMD